MKNMKEELSKITSKLILKDNPKIVYLQRRSESCNLPSKSKGKTE